MCLERITLNVWCADIVMSNYIAHSHIKIPVIHIVFKIMLQRENYFLKSLLIKSPFARLYNLCGKTIEVCNFG